MTIEKPNLYLPLVVVLGYVAFGYVVSVFGPISYVGYDRVTTGVYLAAFAVLFTVGYHQGIRRYKTLVGPRAGTTELSLRWPTRLIWIISPSHVGIFLYAVVSGQIDYSFQTAGLNYMDAYQDYERNVGAYSLRFITTEVLYLPTLAMTVLGIYEFGRLGRVTRLVFCVFLISYASYYVFGLGKQKQLGDLLVLVFAVALIKAARRGRGLRVGNYLRVAALVTVAIVTFGNVLSGRYAAVRSDDISEWVRRTHPSIVLDTEHWVFNVVSPEIGFPVALVSVYLTNGYYGLSLALQLPFVWTKLVGHSYSLMVIYDRVLGGGFVLPDTYVFRAGEEFNWGMTKWHSAFAWLASDFTFVGTLLVLAMVGYLWATVWMEAIGPERRGSIIFFSYLFLGLIFLPANNQLVHSPGSLLTFYALLGYCLVDRRRRTSVAGPPPARVISGQPRLGPSAQSGVRSTTPARARLGRAR